MLWAIAVGYNRSRRVNVSVTPFVVVELLVAVIFPILLYISGILMAIVLDYITYGALDGREALPRILRNVKLEKGAKSDFWIIVNSFYFELPKCENTDTGSCPEPEQMPKKPSGACHSCYSNRATWLLIIISGMSISLAVSYFVDITLDTQVTVNACNDTRIDRDFSCFNASTLVFVDCVNDVDSELLHCFKFYEFGVDVDIVTSIAASFAFYLVAVTTISNIFLAMKIFLHLYHSNLWGYFFIFAGIFLLVGVIAVIVIWANGYISALTGELPRLNIINLAQMLNISLLVILVGVLIVSCKWVEMGPVVAKDKAKKKEGVVTHRSSPDTKVED